MNWYGIPYQGSKSRFADSILAALPDGKRFVDLFGGGFSMSHAALLSGKFEEVMYNDLNPVLAPLIKDAIAGKYSYEVFKPEFITREKFMELQDTDGYVRCVWSFGNNGRDYLFGKDLEPFKHILHDFIVFGVENEALERWLPGYRDIVTAEGIKERRLQWTAAAKKHKKRCDLQQLQQLERLQQLQQLERLQQLEELERIERLQFTSMDYRSYEYREGDIVYCDPPYDTPSGKEGWYGTRFDFPAFLDWVFTRSYPVWLSSYEIADKRLTPVWQKETRTQLAATNNDVKRTECVYVNAAANRVTKKYIQQKLFF